MTKPMAIYPFHSREQQSMAAVSWHERLQSADSVDAIISTVRDFLAQFSPYELHALPEACRPAPRFSDAEDISAYAYDLARHQGESDAPHAELIDKLSHFFSHAASRLAQVTARRNDDKDSQRRSA